MCFLSQLTDIDWGYFDTILCVFVLSSARSCKRELNSVFLHYMRGGGVPNCVLFSHLLALGIDFRFPNLLITAVLLRCVWLIWFVLFVFGSITETKGTRSPCGGVWQWRFIRSCSGETPTLGTGGQIAGETKTNCHPCPSPHHGAGRLTALSDI